MSAPLHHRVALCLLLAAWPLSAVSAASIITSSNPDATLSTQVEEERRVELTVESTPSGAEVSLNGRPRGLTPLRLSNLSPGISVLEVTAPGYETARLRVRLQRGESVGLSVPLRRETGSLRVDVQPADAEVLFSGGAPGEPTDLAPTPGEPFFLPTGEYLARVRRFGYRERTIPFEIAPGVGTNLRVVLEPAPFSVAIRETGDRGGFALSATARGSALVTVRDPVGTEVLRRQVILDAPETRALRGEELPPGDYRVMVRAENEAGDSRFLLSRGITVPEKTAASLIPWSGTLGLLYAPLPASRPPGEPTIGTGWAHVPDPRGIDVPISAVSLATSIGIGRDLTLFFGGRALLFETQERNRSSFSLGGLGRLWESDGMALGLGGRATIDAPLGNEKSYLPDFFGTPEGVFLFVPASLEIGPATLIAAPEGGFTWRKAQWGSGEEDRSERGGILGTRVGAGVRFGSLFIGASGRLSWTPGGETGGAAPTAQIGTEARLSIPDWGTAISPFFALAGPWGNLTGFFGLSVTVGRY